MSHNQVHGVTWSMEESPCCFFFLIATSEWFTSLRLLFLASVFEQLSSFVSVSFSLTIWFSTFDDEENKGGSRPLRRQKTRSTVSFISFPNPSFSRINSQTDLDAFSSTGPLLTKATRNMVNTFFENYDNKSKPDEQDPYHSSKELLTLSYVNQSDPKH